MPEPVRITLPAGPDDPPGTEHWAVLRDPTTIRYADEQSVVEATSRAAGQQLGTMAAVVAAQEAAVRLVTLEWSLTLPLPSASPIVLGNLTRDQMRILAEACWTVYGGARPDFSTPTPPADVDSPTVPSAA